MVRLKHAWQVCFLAAAAGAAAAVGAAGEPAPAEPLRPPRLAVLVVVDQMRADYLDRFAPLFEHGFARLLGDGRLFTDARHLHAITSTGPGHAALATGCHPARHGIIANELPDGAGGFAKVGEDPGFPDLEGGDGGAAPTELLVSALGDWLKQAHPEARVAAVSYKTRSAVMLGGRRPDVCLYVHGRSGAFTTSTYYADRLPAFAERYNREQPAAARLGTVWEARLGAERYAAVGCTGDAMPYEGRADFTSGKDASFPHVIERISDLVFSPFGDQRVLEVALAAAEALDLGGDAIPDLLLVSLSSADYVGHAFGPDSWEMADYYDRLDEALGLFLDGLERRVPRAELLVALSADHGVNPIVERSLALGFDAGRIRVPSLCAAIDAALDVEYGGADWVLEALPDVYLDARAVERCGVPAAAVRETAAAAARALRGIADAWPRERLLDRDAAVPAAHLLSFHAERSGDVILRFAPRWHLDYLEIAPYVKANHSTAYDYDQRVPLIFYGHGVAPGRDALPIATVDVAPTLAERLGVGVPGHVDGRARPLPAAVATPPAGAGPAEQGPP